MFVIIGMAVLFGSIFVGYTMAGGKIAVLIQISEYIVIGGAALGAALISNPISVVTGTFKAALGAMKPSPYTRATYDELLSMCFNFFQLARREGLVALEQHVEDPESSDFFSEYPAFKGNHHALTFLADTMKVVLTGAVEPHDLAEVLEADMECHHEAAMVIPAAINKTGDAMPGFGIVAAVLGVVITMGSIGGDAAVIGHHVAAALVGTFLGILLAYGIFGPLAQAVENQIHAEHQYLGCIKTAVLAFARGDSPLTCAEFARRAITPALRPTFGELEALTARK
jgi:chemotaxis protein MotA